MDPGQLDSLVHRLVTDPHDEEALSYAHQAGAADPKSYALLLERVGVETRDPSYASHWLSEAANVWSTTLGDAHRAARVLMQAIDRDPTQRTPSDRLADLYRDKGDYKALVALLERRTKALSGVAQTPEIRTEMAAMHEELARLWKDNLQQPKKAQENLRRASELSERSDSAPDLDGLRAEIAAKRATGDLAGAQNAVGRARALEPEDAGLQQEFGSLIVDRLAAGEPVAAEERALGAALLVGLAEAYDGEHGLAYSAGALDIDPGNDRAVQLYAFYAQALDREDDVAARYLAYIDANPTGAMAGEARWLLAASYEGAGQPEHAIEILEPLRSLGDPEATAKLGELYAQLGQPMPPASSAALTTRGGDEPSVSRRGPTNSERVDAALDAAQALVKSNKRLEAYQKYREVLEVDAVHPEALSWVQDYLRTKRDYAPLRDVLLLALRAPGESVEARRDRLREIAGLCEGNLRDNDGAINAWKQLLSLDRSDEPARQALTRTLERTQRWDELANLYEQEENAEVDVEKKLALQKKLAAIHEGKRKDPAAAADTLERIANLTPEDDQAIATAAKMFTKVGALDRAAQVIEANVGSVTDEAAKSALFERLGELYVELDDPARAGEAYAKGAAPGPRAGKLWEAAERCFVSSELWDRAADAAVERSGLEPDDTLRARHYARSADYLGRGLNEAGALANLVRASELDPTNEEYAQQLTERYTSSMQWGDLVQVLLKRGDHASDAKKRTDLRKQAADLYANRLNDREAARQTWRRILAEGDDEDAAEHLIEDAVERADHAEAVELLQRLEKAAATPADKARVALREAELLAESVGDVGLAIERYERIVAELDPTCRLALQAIADLQEARDNPTAAAEAIERELNLVVDVTERAPIGTRLARLYDLTGDQDKMIRALEVVRAADADDFEALALLCDLCEKGEKWSKLAELLAQRIEIEGDEAEAAQLTLKLSGVLADKLDRGDEGLATLAEMADNGDESVREAYIALGDRLGWGGIVATKMVDWYADAKGNPSRARNLRGAFERFAAVGRDEDAVKVASEIVRTRGADRALAEHLEKLATKTKNLDALSAAHDLIARELTGVERALELVRQAEAQVPAGSPALEAIQHGEAGLTSVPSSEAEALLARLAALAQEPEDVIDLYERQVTRCKTPAERVHALGRAAQVASWKGSIERARGFFDLALTGAPGDEAVQALEQAARDGDDQSGGDALRRALSAAFESGGLGARDGGRTRGALLRRASWITFRDLDDVDQAFALLGNALVAHVEGPTLDALEIMAHEAGDIRRAEATLSRALEEVFDGPLVRQLLARRAKLRRDHLSDPPGAAADLKKLHDLSPNDAAVMSELTALLTELGDYRALVRLFEDQILRGKDTTVRAELARQVARMWEVELTDPREAADAWRRVLRMKQGDAEATAGLERAKSNMLKTRDSGAERAAAVTPEEALDLLGEPGAKTTPVPTGSDEGVARPTAAAATEEHDSDPPEPNELTHVDMSPPQHPVGRSALHPESDGALAAVPPAPVTIADLPGVDFVDETYPQPSRPIVAFPTPLEPARAAPPTPAAPDSDLAVDVDLAADDDEIAADAAEVVEVAVPKNSEPPPIPKRSVPPPLPRSS